jgi:hypothetical protein
MRVAGGQTVIGELRNGGLTAHHLPPAELTLGQRG